MSQSASPPAPRRAGRRPSAGVVSSAAIAIALVAVVCAAAAVADEAVVPPSPLPLDWCLQRAAEVNPELAVQSAMRDAARERVGSVGRWDDPRVAYEASNIPTGDFDFDSTPLSGHQLGLRQRIPFPGLLGRQRDAARKASDAAQADLDDRLGRIAGTAEVRWASLGYAQRALDITDRNIELVRQLAEVAEVKYRVGSGLQQDVLRAQVALTALLEERLQRESALEAAAAALATVLDLPPDTALPRTTALDDASPLPELDAMVTELEEKSPVLQAARDRIAQAEEELEATRLEGLPDVDLGIGYRIRQNVAGDPVDGDDFISAGVTLRLPVDRAKWRAREAERHAMVRRAKAAYRSARAELRAHVRSIHAELVRADSERKLLETGLVPQARQSLDSSRSGYEVGRVDFLSLLDSQVRLLDAELRYQRALADRRSAYAALEATLGEKLR
jgi:outer membrane protein TolC